MVETSTARLTIGPMELFLIAAISRGGLNTLYSLQQAAGLQPGSLKQVIKTLEEAGLLVRAEGGKRGRRTMTLTEAGETYLAKRWADGLDARREMESILRSATLGLYMNEIGASIYFLGRCAQERQERSTVLAPAIDSDESTPNRFHEESRAYYLSRRRALEVSVLEELAAGLRQASGHSDLG